MQEDEMDIVDRLNAVREEGSDPDLIYEAAAEICRLRDAIRQTLDENGHLADGEVCTLLALKVALRKVGTPWEGDELHNAELFGARGASEATPGYVSEQPGEKTCK
jgi:hypothetical protein